MTEVTWVETIAEELRDYFTANNSLRIETQFPLPYGYEIRNFGSTQNSQILDYKTDLVIIEDLPNAQWRPRVIVEAKIDSITTHDAITYSQKASSHKSVCPYLRYGVMLGNRKHYPLPGRLYRHGQNFDFMVSFTDYALSSDEKAKFLNLLKDEIQASQTLEKILYESRSKARDHFTLLHRKLILD